MASEGRRPSLEARTAGRKPSLARSRSESSEKPLMFQQISWDNLIERVEKGEKMSTASVRVTWRDNERTKLLKEVLNGAAKATLSSRKSTQMAGAASVVESLGGMGHGLNNVHKVKQRYESIHGSIHGGGPLNASSKSAAGQEKATSSSMLDDDSVLSVAAGMDPDLKGVLAQSGKRIAGLASRLERESKPTARPAPRQAPEHGPDVVVVSWGGAARQREQQRLEETADQVLDKFIQFEPLDALEAVFADDADHAALAKAFPGRANHNPALVRLTDYVLERPEEFRRATRRVDSGPPSFTVKERTMRHIGNLNLEGRPSAVTVQSTSSEAASGRSGAQFGALRARRLQHPQGLRPSLIPGGSPGSKSGPIGSGKGLGSPGSTSEGPRRTPNPIAPRAQGRGLLEAHKLFRDLNKDSPGTGGG